MSLIDTLALLACLIAGLWVFGQFHHIGIRGGVGLVATLVVLWLGANFVVGLFGTLSQGVALVLGSVGGLGGGLLVLVLIVLLALGLRLWWVHRQAQQFFDF